MRSLMMAAALLAATHAHAQSAAPAQPADQFVSGDGLRLHDVEWGRPDRLPLRSLQGAN